MVALAPRRMRPSTRADPATTPGLGGSSAGAHALELRFQLIGNVLRAYSVRRQGSTGRQCDYCERLDCQNQDR